MIYMDRNGKYHATHTGMAYKNGLVMIDFEVPYYKGVGYWHTHPYKYRNGKKYATEYFSESDLLTVTTRELEYAYVGTIGGKIMRYAPYLPASPRVTPVVMNITAQRLNIKLFYQSQPYILWYDNIK